MSVTPSNSNLKRSLSQRDIEAFSALKMPISPQNHPEKIKEFLRKRQLNYL